MKIQEVTEITKELFIEVAEDEMAETAAELSTSRLSVMTGIHRKDVVRLRETDNLPKKGTNMVARILGQWQQDKRFRTKSGKPRVLEYEGLDSEFADLVATVSRELNPYTVLFELERVGAVSKKQGRVKLVSRTFMPKRDAVEGFRLLSGDAEDLLVAVEENVFDEPEVPNLHIKTEYDNIPVSAAPKLRKWILEQGSAFQQRVRNYVSQFDRDVNPEFDEEGESIRVAIGTFSRIELPIASDKE